MLINHCSISRFLIGGGGGGGGGNLKMPAARLGFFLAGLVLIASCAGGGGGSGALLSGYEKGPDPGPGNGGGASTGPSQIIQSSHAADGRLLGFFVRELDPRRRVTRIGNYTTAGELFNYASYTYDSAGVLNRIGFYNISGALTRYEVYGYDGMRRQIHRGFYNASGGLTRFEAHAYDAAGRRTYRGFYNASAHLARYELYTYPAARSQTSTAVMTADGAEDDLVAFEVRIDGAAMRPIRIDFYNAMGNLTGHLIRSYRPDMQLNQTHFYDGAGVLNRYRIYTYTDDDRLAYITTYNANHAQMGYASYGYGDVAPPVVQPPRPAMRPGMDSPATPAPVTRARTNATSRPPANDDAPPPAAPAPVRSIPNTDGDDLPDLLDNCPRFNSAEHNDADGDGIGDVCEAQPVTDLAAVADSSTAVNLSWVNPAGSNLSALRISHRRQDGTGSTTPSDITAMVNRTAGARVTYRVSGLAAETSYTLTVGGTDLRHGRICSALTQCIGECHDANGR